VFSCTCGDLYEGEACDVEIVVATPAAVTSVASENVETSEPVVVCGGNNCSDRGVCLANGTCDCMEGYEGEDCSVEVDTPGADEF